MSLEEFISHEKAQNAQKGQKNGQKVLYKHINSGGLQAAGKLSLAGIVVLGASPARFGLSALIWLRARELPVRYFFCLIKIAGLGSLTDKIKHVK